MNKKNKHVGKTSQDREAYKKYLQRSKSEPTLDKSLKFSQSNTAGEDLSEPVSRRRRKADFSQQLKKHIKENWIKYFVVIFISLLSYYAIEVKIKVAEINVKLDNMKNDITSLKNDYKDQLNINHQQDINIKELETKIKLIENYSLPHQ